MKITEPTSCAIRGRSKGEWHSSSHTQQLEVGGGISNSITSVAKDAYILCPKRTEEEKRRRHKYGDTGAKFRNKQYEPRQDGCSNTIDTVTHDNMLMETQEPKRRYRIRKLTPRECFRLMDVPEDAIDKMQAAGISESQQYKLAGNSIVVACMYHIFTNLFIDTEKPEGLLF